MENVNTEIVEKVTEEALGATANNPSLGKVIIQDGLFIGGVAAAAYGLWTLGKKLYKKGKKKVEEVKAKKEAKKVTNDDSIVSDEELENMDE